MGVLFIIFYFTYERDFWLVFEVVQQKSISNQVKI